MKLVGLTGGIAAGKSTVSKRLANRYPIIDADLIAREVVLPGRPAYRAILRQFADIEDLLLPDGQLNRARLGEVVFADAERRKQLNRCTHPYIRRQILWQIVRYWLSGYAVAILDAPLLIESRLDRLVSYTVVVDCPEEMQLERLCRRDGLGEEAAKQRIAAQLPMAQKRQHADFVIENDGTLAELDEQVEQLVARLRPWRVWVWLCWVAPIGLLAAAVQLGWRAVTSRAAESAKKSC